MSESKLNPFARRTNVVLPEQLRDAFGRVLAVGDHCALHLPQLPLFRVSQIAPVFDPKLPPNLMDITVQCVLKFRAARDEAITEFSRVLTAEERPTPPPREEIRDEPEEKPSESLPHPNEIDYSGGGR
jgi:hypothetical protein